MGLTYKLVPTTHAELTGFNCNKCGKSFTLPEDQFEVDEMFFYEDTGGYDSIWGDGNEVEIVLCQTCAYGLLKDYATVKTQNP
jgi:hypothetical protein